MRARHTRSARRPDHRLWLSNPARARRHRVRTSSRPDWNFATPRALPPAWINNAFFGWDGRASILWPDRRLALDIEAEPRLSIYIVYSPAGGADFFCFEPVTHPVDAHNMAGGAQANCLTILGPQETMSAACRFRPRRLD